MHAVQIVGAGTPVELAEVADPVAAPGEVVVQIAAAGICHSDAHYRQGDPAPRLLPITPGHEVAGAVVEVGDGISTDRIGERVALHYLESCGTCTGCRTHGEQFCHTYRMLGLTRHGGYAERVAIAATSAVPIPDAIATEHAAVMMCSSATALHALHRGRTAPGETVAVFGAGGLGMSAIQLANTFEAATVYAVDIDDDRLAMAARHGAIPVPAGRAGDAVSGVDVALVMVGAVAAYREALDVLGPRGRAVAVGLMSGAMPLAPYADFIVPEHEVIGAADHTRDELDELFAIAGNGGLDLSAVVAETVSLNADEINAVLDRLDVFGPGMRTVIVP